MIPRIIHSLWYQGIDRAPACVQLCFERWRRLNPHYELRICAERDVRSLLWDLPIPLESIPIQAVSDIVRIRLLTVSGGVWTDATVLPLQPLDGWIEDYAGAAGFFAFEKPKPDRPIASWFLAASLRHPLVLSWSREVTRFWQKPRQLTFYDGNMIPADPDREVSPQHGGLTEHYPYFWFHYLFGYLLRSDSVFATHWAQCRKVSAEPPHRLQRQLGRHPVISPEGLQQAAHAAPVQKLNWRQPYPLSLLSAL